MDKLRLISPDETVNMIAQKLLNDLNIELSKNNINWTSLKNEDLTSLALLFIAYRKAKIPRSVDEILTMASNEKITYSPPIPKNEYKTYISKSDIYKRYKKIKNVLGMKICQSASLVSQSCIVLTKPEQLIPRYGEELKLDISIINDAIKMSKHINFDSSPATIAAGCLYLAADLHDEFITVVELADTAAIGTVTVSKSYPKILEELDKINYWGKPREKEIMLQIKNQKRRAQLKLKKNGGKWVYG